MKDQTILAPEKGNTVKSINSQQYLIDRKARQRNAKQTMQMVYTSIAQLESKKVLLQGEYKQQFQKGLDKLKAERRSMENQYNALLLAGDNNWQEINNGFERTVNNFQQDLNSMISIVK